MAISRLQLSLPLLILACSAPDPAGSDATSESSGDGSGTEGSSSSTGDTGSPIECVPGDARCSPDGESIETCDDEGQWSPSSCGEDSACTEASGEPSCYSTLDCMDDDVVCWDSTSYLTCTGSGEWGAPVACPAGKVCNWSGTTLGDICEDQVFGLDYALYIDSASGVDCQGDVGSPSDVFVRAFAWRSTDTTWQLAGTFPVDTCPLAWSAPVIIPSIDNETAVLLEFWDEDVSDHDYLGEACKGDGEDACYWLTEDDLEGQSLLWEKSASASVRLIPQ